MPCCSPVLGARDPAAGSTGPDSVRSASPHVPQWSSCSIVHLADLLPGAQGWKSQRRPLTPGSGWEVGRVSEWRTRSALPPAAPTQPASRTCGTEPGVCGADCELADDSLVSAAVLFKGHLCHPSFLPQHPTPFPHQV